MKKLIQIAILLAFLQLTFFSQIALSAVHFGVSGNVAKNTLGLEEHRSQAWKGSVGFDLGRYFRIGFSARQQITRESGHKDVDESEDTEDLKEYESKVRLVTYSTDLMVALYAGQIFTPFIFGGYGVNRFQVENFREDQGTDTAEGSYPAPNYGVGLAISLNRNFSLKITNTWTIGIRTNPEDTEDQEFVQDNSLDIGISYKFH